MLLALSALLAPLSALLAPRPLLLAPRPAPACRGGVRMATQVVTDIDDTIKSSGGLAIGSIPLGGVDTTYARNAFYPGVFQFGAELAGGGRRLPWGPPPPDVAVLTARAEEFRWALEIKQDSALCVRYADVGRALRWTDWGVGPILYGSVAEWVCQERKGWRKCENFKRLHAMNDARQRYVFVGDNGSSEKDLEAAELIAEAFPGLLRAVFLHAVSADQARPPRSPAPFPACGPPSTQSSGPPAQVPAPLPEDGSIGGAPLLYFRTYATAAAKAARAGLFGPAALDRILDAVEQDMAADGENIPAGSANEALLREEIDAARRVGRPRNAVANLVGGRWRRAMSEPAQLKGWFIR